MPDARRWFMDFNQCDGCQHLILKNADAKEYENKILECEYDSRIRYDDCPSIDIRTLQWKENISMRVSIFAYDPEDLIPEQCPNKTAVIICMMEEK